MASPLDGDCPACGGSGGGPFGPPGSAWDVEDYVCPRCRGVGVLAIDDASAAPKPGIAKTAALAASRATRKQTG